MAAPGVIPPGTPRGGPPGGQELLEVVRLFREHPGLRSKAQLRAVSEALGSSDWVSGPGDDAAAIPAGPNPGDGYLLVAGEAVFPPLVAADPFGAGIAAVVANVNDVAAMGGRPVALVDTIVGPEAAARRVLDGMRFASELYGVPVVGGHLTLRGDQPAGASVFVLGRAERLLAATNVEEGQSLLVATCLEGHFREDFPFFSSLAERGGRLRGDLDVLARLAADGLCSAAKDVSMAGLLGSLAMLLEPTRCGASVDLAAIPRPPGAAIRRWTATFPMFSFLLTTPPENVPDCRSAFAGRGLSCREVGTVDATGRLRARLGGEEATLLDLTREDVTGLARTGGSGAGPGVDGGPSSS